jgi:hypothetical protein
MRSRMLGRVGGPVTALATALGLAVTAGPAPATAAGGDHATASATGSARRAAALPTHVNDCWSTDRLPPVVDSVEVSPATVDTSSGPLAVRVTAGAHDVGGPGPASGVRRVQVWLENDVTGAETQTSTLTLRPDGLWHGSVVVPGATTATYDAVVSAVDRSGQGTLSLQRSPVTQRRFTDVVSTTGAPPPSGDTTPPSVTGLTLSSTHVDTRHRARIVTATATVTDSGTGVGSVTLGLNAAGRGTDSIGDRSYTLQLVAGSTDRYRGRFRLTRWTGNHTELLSILARDDAGNATRLLHQRLAALGLPSKIRVTSGPLDTQGPRLVKVLRAARTVDVRKHARWYPVRLLLADPQKVASAEAKLSSGRSALVQLHRVGGTPARGVWVGRLRVPRCISAAGPHRLHVGAFDRNGVGAGSLPRRIRIRGLDHVPPQAHVTWRRHAPDVHFSEPVHGIGSATVQVYDANPDSLSLLPGTWHCFGAAGRRINCRSGSVTSATFTPDDAGVVPGVIDWEPGQHLDVLDAHGNPFAGLSLSPDVVD